MKITAIETLRTEEFANVLWVRVHTDAGVVGLGETFYGAAAVEAHVHDTLAARLLGKDPLHIEAHSREMVNLPMAQSSTGVEYRAASAIDIALWDLFGKVCGQPVHQMLGGLCRDRLRVYNTCAGTRYVSTKNITPVGNWNRGAGRYEDLDAFMTDADALAEDLLADGITAMKIWPFDPIAAETQGLDIGAAQLREALRPFEQDPPRRRRRHGHHGRAALALEPAGRQQDRPRARALRADVDRGPDPDELAAGAGRARPLDADLDLRPRDAGLALAVTRTCSTATPWRSAWSTSAGPAA